MSKNIQKKNKRFIKAKNVKSGRSRGKITVRHQGGGHKQKYRIIDFSRLKNKDIPAKIESIEYDPNRNALIASIVYENGARNYILAPHKAKVGDKIITSDKTSLKQGNRLRLENLSTGTFIYNIEIQPEQGGKLVRSAGNYAQMMGKEGKYVQLMMPSKEIRLVLGKCFATVGQVSNPQANTRKLYKAGQNRWRGIRPTVRGSAMNPVDHPHGGGEGRAPIGLKHPKTPWGKPALGKKTRKKKYSDKLIIKRRKRKKRKK